MKKNLLFGITICISSLAVGQNSTSISSNVTPLKANATTAGLALPVPKRFADGSSYSFVSSVVNESKRNSNGGHPLASPGDVDSTIGTSIYDLQTNSSVCNRMVLNNDGTVSATWTMSHSTTALPSNDRGTGYTYFDGTRWIFTAGAYNASIPPALGPQTRLETIRVGWPNIAVTDSIGEVIVTHQATGSGGALNIEKRPVKGTGAWTESVLAFTDTWPRMVVAGANKKTIHIIAQTSGANTTVVPYHHQNGAISYYRSLDGGATWPIERAIIPEIDSTFYLGFGGDDYAIDAKGDTIAIAIGGQKVDVILLKSIDNGTSWTKTIIKRFPIPLFDPATMVTDTTDPSGATGTIDSVISNDGSVAVLLDHQGMAHVWYGRMVVKCQTAGTTGNAGLLYYPYTDGLMYWNENMGATSEPSGSCHSIEIAHIQNLYGDNYLHVYQPGSTGNTLGFGSYFGSLTSMPSAGIDAQGRIYLSYASIYEGINDQGVIPDSANNSPGKSFRHTYIMRLDSASTSWCNPIDISDPGGLIGYTEGVFGAMTRKVDGFVHVLVQTDGSPGDALAMTAAMVAIDPQSGTENNMIYYKIPIANVECGVGVNDIHPTVSEINLYPNPASNTVTLKFNINRISKADVKVYNIMGQEVTKFDNQPISNGTTLNINIANYQSGIYFVNSIIDGKSYSKKLIVE